MHILLVTPRLPVAPYSIGPMVGAIAHALIGRGHRLTIAADSIEDPLMFEGCGLCTHRDFSQTSTDFPPGFERWYTLMRGRIDHDASLSFARACAADVIFPLDPTRRAWLAQNSHTRSFVGFAAHLVKHYAVFLPHVPDTRAHAKARTLAATDLPRFSLLAPATAMERDGYRASVRAAVDVAPGRMVLVLSAPESFGSRLQALLGALAIIARDDRERAPVLLALARDTFTLRAGATRAGVLGSLRIFTPTADIRPALLAADYALAPFAARVREQPLTGALGRLVTDALWLGTPVIALARAMGADLIAARGERAATPGVLVPEETCQAWVAALRMAQDPATHISARAEAEQAALALSFAGFVAGLEGALLDVKR